MSAAAVTPSPAIAASIPQRRRSRNGRGSQTQVGSCGPPGLLPSEATPMPKPASGSPPMTTSRPKRYRCPSAHRGNTACRGRQWRRVFDPSAVRICRRNKCRSPSGISLVVAIIVVDPSFNDKPWLQNRTSPRTGRSSISILRDSIVIPPARKPCVIPRRITAKLYGKSVILEPIDARRWRHSMAAIDQRTTVLVSAAITLIQRQTVSR